MDGDKPESAQNGLPIRYITDKAEVSSDGPRSDSRQDAGSTRQRRPAKFAYQVTGLYLNEVSVRVHVRCPDGASGWAEVENGGKCRAGLFYTSGPRGMNVPATGRERTALLRVARATLTHLWGHPEAWPRWGKFVDAREPAEPFSVDA